VTGTRSSARGLLLAILIPILAFMSLSAWSLSSPVGSTPDDDFHLASIWCGLGDRDGLCENRDDDPVERYVPTPLTTATCYAFLSAESGECWNGEEAGMSNVDRANVDRLYPPVFYGVMSIFASENVAASVMAMKLFNSAFAVGLLSAVFFALPRRLRPALLISVIGTAVPLGVFVIGSTNPSSWALISAATLWISLYGALQSSGRQRIVLLALSVFGAAIGAGSRADSAVYAVFGVIVALLLGVRLRRSQWLPVAVAGVIVVMSILFYVSAWQGASIVGGLDSERLPLTGSQHLSNFLSAPSLWMGALGGWGLGWLDTPMPTAVSVLAGAVFWGAVFVGLGRSSVRRGIAVAMAVGAMWLVPVVLLAQSRMLVGELIQPRYLLPLLIIALGVASVRFDAEPAWKGMRMVFAAAALSFAFTVALHFNIQRYTTGAERITADPGAGAEWWWAWAPSPLVVWVGGSLAFVGMFVALWFVMRADTAVSVLSDVDARSTDTPEPLACGSSAGPRTAPAVGE
jgi:hypothetical protein